MQRGRGIVYLISSSFAFAAMAMFVKLAGDLPTVQKAFFRNLIAFAVATVVVFRNREKLYCPKKLVLPLSLRVVLGTAGFVCNFYAVDRILLADASMLNKLAPFFALVFAHIFLREKMSTIQLGCVFIALLGTVFVVKPGFDFSVGQILPYLIGFVGGVATGGAHTTLRAIGASGKMKNAVVVFYFSGFSCLLMLPFFLYNFEPMTAKQMALLICAGVCASLGQFTVTAAYACAPPREISVYDYSQVIFSAIFGVVLFSQLPDVWSFVGYAIIVSAALISFRHTKKRHAKN